MRKLSLVFILFITAIFIDARDVGIPSASLNESMRALATNLKIKLIRIDQSKKKSNVFYFNYDESVEKNIKRYTSINKFVHLEYDIKNNILMYWDKTNQTHIEPLLETMLVYKDNKMMVTQSSITNLKISLTALEAINPKVDSQAQTFRQFISHIFNDNVKYDRCGISCTWAREKPESLKMFLTYFKDEFKLTKHQIKEFRNNKNVNDVNIFFLEFKPFGFSQEIFDKILNNPQKVYCYMDYYIDYYATFFLKNFLNRLKNMNFWQNYSDNKYPRNFTYNIINSIALQKSELSVFFLLNGISILSNDERRFELIKQLPNKNAFNGKIAEKIEEITTKKINWFAYNSEHWNAEKASWRGDNIPRKDRWGNFNIPEKKEISKKYITELNSEIICYKYNKPFVIAGLPLLQFEQSDLKTPEKAYISLYSARTYEWKKKLLYENYSRFSYRPFYSWYKWNSGLKKIVEIKYRIDVIGKLKRFTLFPTTHFMTKIQADCEGYRNTQYKRITFLIHTNFGWKVMMREDQQTEKIKRYAIKQLKSGGRH